MSRSQDHIEQQLAGFITIMIITPYLEMVLIRGLFQGFCEEIAGGFWLILAIS
jgi:hypothetical protein